MADSNIAVTEGSGKNVDTRTNDAGDHRQVVVTGHPTATDSVAEVLGKDPSSNTEGLVVRDVNTSAVVSGLESVRVRNIIDGTITTVTGITNSIAVHVLSTGGTINVSSASSGTLAISAKDGSFAVYFSPTSPSIGTVNRVDRVFNLVDGTISAGTLDYVTRVRNVVDGTLTTVTGVDRVRNIVDGTITTVTNVTNITNTVSIKASNGTFAVYFSPASPSINTVTRVDRVHNIVDGTISTVAAVTGITNTIGVVVMNPSGGSYNDTAPFSVTIKDPSTSNKPRVFTSATDTNSTAAESLNTRAYLFAYDSVGDNWPRLRGNPTEGIRVSDVSGTMTIPQALSGTASTAGGSGSNTIKAPVASRNIKVYAYSITTTAQVGITPRFTTGGSAGATELWRVALQAPAQGISGANLAVTPPGYLFSTGVGNTLALYLDSASLVHYSISYFLESA